MDNYSTVWTGGRLVEGDPVEEITIVHNVGSIVKQGRVVKRRRVLLFYAIPTQQRRLQLGAT